MAQIMVKKGSLAFDTDVLTTAGPFIEFNDAVLIESLPDYEVSFSVNWQSCNARDSLISTCQEIDGAFDIEYENAGASTRWFFPHRFTLLGKSIKWEVTSLNVIIGRVRIEDAKFEFSHRLARPVLWLWLKWKQLWNRL